MDTSPCDFDKLEPKAVEKTIEAIDKALKDQPKDKVDKKKKQKVSYGKKNWPEALKRYQEQEQILGDRNSYSKTDPDYVLTKIKVGTICRQILLLSPSTGSELKGSPTNRI